jgi:hypothetical protein
MPALESFTTGYSMAETATMEQEPDILDYLLTSGNTAQVAIPNSTTDWTSQLDPMTSSVGL